MIPKTGITPQYIKAAATRRLWYIVLPFFVIALGTLAYCIKAPRVFRSSTLILVQPQEVPSEYVRSTVTTDATARLNTLKEQVMSRPRLESIITEYDLYSAVRRKATMFDAIQSMRKNISVKVNESRSRRDTAPASFEISYEGENPRKVRDVTAAISNLFIEDDLRLRGQQARGTSQFLERELDRMRETLRAKEDLLREFKEQNMGLLPEQIENNYRILGQLQQHLDSLNESLQQTEDRKVLLQTQLSRLENLQSTGPAPTRDQGLDVEQELTLPELRQRLETLLSRYSEKHPDVIRLKTTIAKRESREAAREDTVPAPVDQPERELTEAQQLLMVQREDLQTQLKLIDKEILAIQNDISKTKAEIAQYRQRIEEGPKIEQRLTDLNRDYEEASENYQSLLQKKLQAELAENLESTQKGEQFRILEPANLPEKPYKPNIIKALGMGFMLALGSGLGLAYLREYMDPTFWNRKNLEATLELPVLASVPLVHTKSERRWITAKRIAAACVVIGMLSVLVYSLLLLRKLDPAVFPI